VLLLRGAAGSVSGFNSSAIALLGTQVPEDRLGFALGWMASGELIGNLLGPLCGGILADRLHDYRTIFGLTSGLAFAASLTCALFIREHFIPGTSRTARRGPIWHQLREIARHPSLAPMFVFLLVAQLCAMGVDPIVPLFVASLVHGSWVSTATGLAIAVTAIGDVIASPWLGKRSDRIGYRRVLLLSLAGAAIFTLPQGLSGVIWVFIGLRFFVGMFLGGILPTANAWIGRMTPPEQRGQVFGTMSSAAFLGMAVGPILGATIAAHLGFVAVFATVGLLTLGNLVWVARVVRPYSRADEAVMEGSGA
jgi:MFS transporter, DHA1 family, multidrug resistance protein